MHLFLKTCMSTDGGETDRVKHACPQTGWGYNDRSIVYGISDNNIKKKLLKESNLLLQICVYICRAAEKKTATQVIPRTTRSGSTVNPPPPPISVTLMYLLVKLNKTLIGWCFTPYRQYFTHVTVA